MLLGGLLALAGLPIAAAAAAPAPCTGGSVQVMAHPDDDLIFGSPDLLHDTQARRCVRTVILTAGDAGYDSTYWLGREAGLRAAYAQMAGVTNAWTGSTLNLSGRSLQMFTLDARPTVTLVFLRLPDGLGGSGSSRYGFQALQKLVEGSISNISAVDGSETYTRSGLEGTIAGVLTQSRSTSIRTQDWTLSYGQGDHSDHVSTAMLTRTAQGSVGTGHTANAYQAYATAGRPQNVWDPDLAAKRSAFQAYGAHDALACPPGAACPDPDYEAWLRREYLTAFETTGNAARATGVKVTASSENTTDSQTAAKAADGYALGWSVDYTKEWATRGGKAGSWLELAWPAAVTLTGVVLHDRPNLNDQITGGTLTFSDGTSVPIGALPNNGAALTVSFPAKATTSLRVTATSVGSKTENIGLAELEAFSQLPAGVPVSVAGADRLTGLGQAVTLDGSASTDPDGGSITYRWSQVSGPSVPLTGANSAQASFTTPASPAVLTFALTVTDDVGTTQGVDSVTVAAVGNTESNLARTGGPVVTASSENSLDSQQAVKAVDGSATGYPGDYTKEWATRGGKAGSWIDLAWAAPVTLTRVVLHDRPNGNDQVTGGSLTFSDGSSFPVPALANDGSATAVTFPARSVTGLRFTVTSVSGTTDNVGLAELQAWGVRGTGNLPPTANAGPDQQVLTGAAVQLAGSGSDPEGQPVTYLWTQTAGTVVALSDPTAAGPTFTAPGTATTLTFSLVVSDGTNPSPADTVNVAVAEPANPPPAVNAGADQNVLVGSAVTLTGTANDADGLTQVAWSQTGGQSVTLSPTTLSGSATARTATATFTAPNKVATLTFTLTATDSNGGTAADPVTIRVKKSIHLNSTTDATVTASSESASTDQTADAAVDGGASGTGAEWATVSGGEGSWIELSWARPVAVEQVVLYDRANRADQVTGGTLTFSDGSEVEVGPLANDGSATPVTFEARVTETVRFTITSVSDRTKNVGLAEFEAWGYPAPVAVAGPDQDALAGSLVTLDGSGSTHPTAEPLSYEWVQVSGEPVKLDAADSVAPTFLAPAQPGVFTFVLVVRDTLLTSLADTVTVTTT